MRDGGTGRTAARVGVLLVVLGGGSSLRAQTCASALLAETTSPAVFDGLQLDAATVARIWEAGAASAAGSEVACTAGCRNLTGVACSGGVECVGLTGVNWLNAQCASLGHAPTRTVFLLEQPTLDAGGRWAALNVGRNPGSFNTDLDAAALAICSGCSSVAAPYLGGTGSPAIVSSGGGAGTLTVALSWSPPPSIAQALSDGPDLVTAYGVFFRTDEGGAPPPDTGDNTGWTFTGDLEPDGVAHGGYSTDTSAQIEITVPTEAEDVYFAIGLAFDGSGNPGADPNTVVSAYISDISDPVPLPTSCGGPNHLVLENQTVTGTEEFVACLTITAGSGFVIEPSGDVIFRAGEAVNLQQGFTIRDGGLFAVDIDPTLTEF